mmetsp:Transcript_27902/g.65552  ORF Transcript_27902/g.65552 Transcript_27902/m.65552 type:complete len:85 (+) Transcript_27902:144-398(+)
MASPMASRTEQRTEQDTKIVTYENRGYRWKRHEAECYKVCTTPPATMDPIHCAESVFIAGRPSAACGPTNQTTAEETVSSDKEI